MTKVKTKPRKSTANESTSIYSRIGNVNVMGKKPSKSDIYVVY